MHEHAAHTEALLGVDSQESSDQALGLLGDVFLHVIASLQDLLVEVLHIVCLEGHSAEEEGEKDDASAPQVGLEAPVSLVLDDLGGDVGGSATLLEHHLAALNSLRDTKIGDLDSAFAIKEDVVQFDISMEDRLSVNVTDTFNDLFKQDFSERLLALLSLTDKVKEITSSTKLHNEHDMALSFKCLVQLDHRFVS